MTPGAGAGRAVRPRPRRGSRSVLWIWGRLQPPKLPKRADFGSPSCSLPPTWQLVFLLPAEGRVGESARSENCSLLYKLFNAELGRRGPDVTDPRIKKVETVRALSNKLFLFFPSARTPRKAETLHFRNKLVNVPPSIQQISWQGSGLRWRRPGCRPSES